MYLRGHAIIFAAVYLKNRIMNGRSAHMKTIDGRTGHRRAKPTQKRDLLGVDLVSVKMRILNHTVYIITTNECY